MDKGFTQPTFLWKMGFLSALVLSLPSLLWQCSSLQETLSFNQDIRPILNQKCLSCHGGVRQMGDFSLLFEEHAFQPTESGKVAILPGDPQNSELYRRITHHDAAERMPQKADAALSEKEKELIARWIEQGAEWEDHWAYTPIPTVELPATNSKWPRNGIDHFVLDKLNQKGLKPAIPADKNTLLRRASLDLTGLPPDPEMLEAFLGDESPKAYEHVIDQLLTSPHFGERWASLWLDLARYADSKGYEKDDHRNIWRYRDWVIDAFNADMPFDQFTVEQLAGDLLPHPSPDQLIATAFHRNAMNNDEGGTEDEEFRIAAVIDRVNTTFEVWQGTTMSCAQCHSHPYDPILHEEFYQVLDLFNQSQDHDLPSETPTIAFFEAKDASQIDEIISYVQEQQPGLKIDPRSRRETQIQQALFPLLIPGQCDDFENVIFSGNGMVSNWANNLQAMEGKSFRFKFSQVNVSGLSHISYQYAGTGNDARVEVRLDEVDGTLLNEANFPRSDGKGNRWDRGKYATLKSPALPLSGTHDLIFEIINTTGKIPDGLLSIALIELHYEGQALSPQLKALKEDLLSLLAKGDRTPIMQPKSSTFRRETRVFESGNWMALGKKVQPGVPQSMLLAQAQNPADRLSFARWLVSKENSLTARVMVNRFWEQLFGMGIIESMEDFGTQGLPASHPQLLDYLALQFRDEYDWSVKALLKEIVMSATYQQSSVVDSEKLEKDPFNRLLSRGPRIRLSAEQVRDQALAVSGLLNDSVGGPSVMPYQPAGVWQIVYSNRQWITPKDDMRHRRGLYTYWKRTSPYPSMMAFDSPSREFCVSRRIRTNSPLQALVTLNDPVYLEAAEALAGKMKKAGGDNLEICIRSGYHSALSKEADEKTVEILTILYTQAEAELIRPLPENTAEENETGNDAYRISDPMTVVANAIMNLDGFVMKE